MVQESGKFNYDETYMFSDALGYKEIIIFYELKNFKFLKNTAIDGILYNNNIKKRKYLPKSYIVQERYKALLSMAYIFSHLAGAMFSFAFAKEFVEVKKTDTPDTSKLYSWGNRTIKKLLLNSDDFFCLNENGQKIINEDIFMKVLDELLDKFKGIEMQMHKHNMLAYVTSEDEEAEAAENISDSDEDEYETEYGSATRQ